MSEELTLAANLDAIQEVEYVKEDARILYQLASRRLRLLFLSSVKTKLMLTTFMSIYF
jgi:hypothetical protein